MVKKKSVPFDPRIKSAINPSAQCAALCDFNYSGELQFLQANVENFLSTHEFTPQGAIVGLLYAYGLRVSEVLNVRGSDVGKNLFVFVKGGKGSANRIVVPIYNLPFWEGFRGCNYSLNDVFSRFFVYREMKKFGIYAYFGNNKHCSVTHSMRHLKVLTMELSGIEQNEVRRFIGHKSIKSIAYYEKAIRSSSGS